jgi:hypothetical protein
MTWLGKILTFVVFIGAIVWMYFTVQAYATRTNWKVEAEKYKKAFEEAKARREDEFRRNQASEDALNRLLALERNNSKTLGEQVESLTAAAKKSSDVLAKNQKALDKADANAVQLAANNQRMLTELDSVRARNTFLEDLRVSLEIARQDALREKVRAENNSKLLQAIVDDQAKRIEELTNQNTQLRAVGGGGPGSLLRTIDKPPPPLLANLRGEVNRVAGDQVEITIGIDAGLDKGSILDVARLEGGGQYLGTIKITHVWPKQAVGTFIPARPGVPFERLRPEELPRKGDEVRPPQGLINQR